MARVLEDWRGAEAGLHLRAAGGEAMRPYSNQYPAVAHNPTRTFASYVYGPDVYDP